MSWNTIKRGCLIALSWFTIVDNVEIDIKAAKTVEPVLADVMKNITRVNTMLQELIKNYEKLEKLSKPVSVEADYTDTEVDELFNGKKKKINRAMSKSTRKAFATEMFFEELEPNEDNASNDTDADTKTDNESIEASKDKEKPHQKQNQDVKEQHAVKRQQKTKTDESNVENKAKKTTLPAIDALKELIKSFSDEIPLNGEVNDKNNSDILPNSFTVTTTSIVLPGLFKKNTKIKSSLKEKKDLEPRLEDYEMPTILRRVRTQNDGEKILIGKAEKTVKDGRTKRKKDKRPNAKEVNVLKNKENPDPKILSKGSELSKEIKKIKKEELKAKALREAYGDACLKLVVRKCFKACQQTAKEACKKKSRCPESFREGFKKYALEGCKQHFGHTVTKSRLLQGSDEEEEKFHDVTRAGYLSMACFSGIRMADEKPPKPGVTVDPIVKTLNILRDKYEVACQEESTRKCYKACTNAVKKACANTNCSSKKLKQLGGICKRKCREAYGSRSNKDSDSSSSEDSSEESEKSKEKSWSS